MRPITLLLLGLLAACGRAPMEVASPGSGASRLELEHSEQCVACHYLITGLAPRHCCRM